MRLRDLPPLAGEVDVGEALVAGEGRSFRSRIESWMPLRCARICATVIYWEFGICGEYSSRVSVSLSLPSSTS